MAFNDSILIKNILILRKKSEAFIDSYNWEVQRQSCQLQGRQDPETQTILIRILSLSPSLTADFLSAGFFIGSLSTSFSLLLQLAISQRQEAFSHLFPCPKRTLAPNDSRHFPYGREGVVWMCVCGWGRWQSLD